MVIVAAPKQYEVEVRRRPVHRVDLAPGHVVQLAQQVRVREAPGLVELGDRLAMAVGREPDEVRIRGCGEGEECSEGAGHFCVFLRFWRVVGAFQVPVWARVLWWVLCPNGAAFRLSGCLVLFVLAETVIEYAGRRAARYGTAMRQHVREGTEC